MNETVYEPRVGDVVISVPYGKFKANDKTCKGIVTAVNPSGCEVRVSSMDGAVLDHPRSLHFAPCFLMLIARSKYWVRDWPHGKLNIYKEDEFVASVDGPAAADVARAYINSVLDQP